MNNDLQLLSHSFEMYYSKAQEAHKNGNLDLAKRNYLLAAEVMMKMAKESKKELQKARFERAKRLIEIAENLRIQKPRKPATEYEAKNESEDGEEQFKAAEIPDVKFSDIAGLDDVKRAITVRVINPIKYPEKYELYGKKRGGGVLLYGPPGTGKTMIARAIAHEANAVFYAVKASDVVSKWVGDSERNIKALFEQARSQPLSIIFIDDLDSLFGSRGTDIHNDKRVNEFLQNIDGFAGRSPNMLLLGATNRPWDVDSAAMRPGRFADKIYIPLPDKPAREFLFKKYTKNLPLSSDVDIEKLTELTQNYSGADIEELCDKAKEEPLDRYIKTGEVALVKQLDFLKAIKAVKPSVNAAEVLLFERYAGIGFKTETDFKNDSLVENENSKDAETDISAKTDNKGLQNAEEPDVSLNTDVSVLNNETNPVSALKKDYLVKVYLKESIVSLLPNIKPKIEFGLSENFDKVYLLFDTQYYACYKNISNFISDELVVDAPGEYIIGVFAENKQVSSFVLTFVKGIEETDLGI